MLADSGAALSVVGRERLDKLPATCYQWLTTNLSQVGAVNGSPIKVCGAVRMQLCLSDRMSETVDMLVAEGVGDELVLRSDFLLSRRGVLDYDRGVLRLRDMEIPVSVRTQQASVRRVLANRTVTIPAGHRGMIPAKLEQPVERWCTAGVTERLSDQDVARGLLARAIVQPDKDGQIPTSILNLSSDSIRVKRGEVIGLFDPVMKGDRLCSMRLKEEPAARPKETRKAELLSLINYGHEGLEPDDGQHFESLLGEFSDIFATSAEELGATQLVEHEIRTGDARPVRVPPRRLAPHLRHEVHTQIDQLKSYGLIEEAQSPWNAPIVCVRKKDGTLRLCVDYRELNKVTERDAIPLPRMDDALDELAGARIFSTMDLHSGYWQVKVKEEDQTKTAFSVPQRGQFIWKRMPFGLVNSPATFTRLMALALEKEAWKTCLVYLDDVLVWATTVEEHLARLRTIFQLIREAGVRLKPQKCEFLKRRVTFLGHIVSQDGVETEPSKIEAVKEWPRPTSKKDVQSFMGLCGYYRRFIPDFSTVAEPLTKLTRKGFQFAWTEEEERAFKELKDRLMSTSVMAHPNFGKDAGRFILDTDASSDVGIGAVLSQVQSDKTEKVIAYASKSLSEAERNYCTTRLELLAVVTFVAKFRYYLTGRRFLLRTDHSSLQWLHNLRDAEGQSARWLEKLAGFDYEVQHRPGVQHGNADGLSRRRHAGSLECPGCASTGAGDPRIRATAIRADQDWLRAAQDADGELHAMKQKLAGDPYDEAALEARTGRQLTAEQPRLQVRHGLLLRTWKGFEQVVVPAVVLQEISQELHAGVAGGHFGRMKTLRKVQERVWRPGWAKTVHKVVQGCVTCAKAKRARKRTAPVKPIRTDGPFERLMVDIIGPLPRSRRGNIYLLTMQDAFSKWPEAVPLRNQRANTVAKAIVERWVSGHGCPRSLHSDQGRNFESRVMKEICQLLRIHKTRTTAYHPAGNGQVERLNRTLKEVLKCWLADDDNGCDWEDLVQPALMAYRSSVHRGTGQTPHAMLYGREMQLPIDLMYRPPQTMEMTSQYATQLQAKMLEMAEAVRLRLRTYQKAQADWTDTRALRGFSIGDLVFVHKPAVKLGEAHKFHIAWKGPYQVLRKIDDHVYEVQRLTNNRRRERVHVENLAECPTQQLEEAGAVKVDQVSDTESVEERSDGEWWPTPGGQPAPVDVDDDAESAGSEGSGATHSSSAQSFASSPDEEVVPEQPSDTPQRRPTRTRRPPDWYGDRVPARC
jgi:dUTPase